MQVRPDELPKASGHAALRLRPSRLVDQRRDAHDGGRPVEQGAGQPAHLHLLPALREGESQGGSLDFFSACSSAPMVLCPIDC